VLPIIVQATGDGEAKTADWDLITCRRGADGAYIASKRSGLQLLAPLVGLYKVRGGHSAVLLRQAHDQYCADRFFHFYLPGTDDGRDIPLNWVLSDTVAGFVWNGAFTTRQVKNAAELDRLRSTLGGSSAP
jgi:hypothetical protein